MFSQATGAVIHPSHLALAAILTLACSDSIGPPAPTTGALAITVVTSGATIDVDPDGYAYSLDGGPGQSLAVNGAVTIANLPTGSHVISLYGLSPNCFISGANPRYADVNASGVASLVAFNVTCDPPDPPTTGGECGYWDYYCNSHLEIRSTDGTRFLSIGHTDESNPAYQP